MIEACFELLITPLKIDILLHLMIQTERQETEVKYLARIYEISKSFFYYTNICNYYDGS